MKKILLSIITCSGLLLANAQESNKFGFNFNHVALSVKDLSKTVDFYKNVLHLDEITNRTQKEGIRWLSLDNEKELHLISYNQGQNKNK